MQPLVRSRAIQGLIAATLGLLSNFPDADPSFSELPEPYIEALVDEVQSADLASPGRKDLLRRLARDGRDVVRVRVADAAGRLWRDDPECGLSILRRLACDPIARVRAAAARSLGFFIERAPAPLRAAVESEWAAASAQGERVALGLALGEAKPSWLTDLALEELASDPSGRVRWAALRAAEAHLHLDPAAYVRLALAHIGDPDRHVRKSARRLLRRAERSGYEPASLGRKARRAERQRARQAMRASAPT